jgi:hypothetical protein
MEGCNTEMAATVSLGLHWGASVSRTGKNEPGSGHIVSFRYSRDRLLETCSVIVVVYSPELGCAVLFGVWGSEPRSDLANAAIST